MCTYKMESITKIKGKESYREIMIRDISNILIFTLHITRYKRSTEVIIIRIKSKTKTIIIKTKTKNKHL